MDYQWLANISIVLAVLVALIKVIQVIFKLAQQVMVAPLVAQLATCTAQMAELSRIIGSLRDTIITMGERVARIEASAKQAHHRIDTLEERVDAHIGQAAGRK